jgi:hypothetical protein
VSDENPVKARVGEPVAELAPERPTPRSRRSFLTAAAAAVGAVAAQSVASVTPAAAANGDAVRAGKTTSATATTTVRNTNAAASSIALQAIGTGSNAVGVRGNADAGTSAQGLLGHATSGTGVHGVGRLGIRGEGTTYGVYGVASSTSGTGVYGTATGASAAWGVGGISATGHGVHGESTSGYAVYGAASGATGVYGRGATGVRAEGTSYGAVGTASASVSVGIRGSSTGSNGTGVYGEANTGANAWGVGGSSSTGYGVYGTSTSSSGVYGTGVTGLTGYGTTYGVYARGSYDGVYAEATGNSGTGVYALASGTGSTGVYAQGLKYGLVVSNAMSSAQYAVQVSGYGGIYVGPTTGNAAFFTGTVYAGEMLKASGSFLIDHPLDPANKYLAHSFVESPDMKNVYDGTVTLNRNGRATVRLPRYFAVLNSDYRYQLTAIGGEAPGLHIASKIEGGRFTIAGGPAGLEVSWQVTGIRQDAWAKKHRIKVESVKKAKDRGKYLNPEVHGARRSQGIGYQKLPKPPKAPEKAPRSKHIPTLKLPNARSTKRVHAPRPAPED